MTGIFIMGQRGEFAENGREIVNIKEDKHHFYESIKDKRVYVGRRTFLSLPFTVIKLPTTWYIYNQTHQDDWTILRSLPCSVKFFTDIEMPNKIEQYYRENDPECGDAMCIGGSRLLEELIQAGTINRLDVTVVMEKFPKADVYLSEVVLEKMSKENLVKETVLKNAKMHPAKQFIYQWEMNKR